MVKYRLTNYLICPKCKNFPLKLTVLETENHPERNISVEPCDMYCSYKELRNSEILNPPCSECMKIEITYGYYICEKCDEWYPIVEAIAIMHTGKYRPKKVIKKFIEKYRDKIPDKYISRELSS